MKKTKKDIYAEYGIQYKKEGSKERIYCDPLNKWIVPVLAWNTNKKVGKAYTFSIMHTDTTFNIDKVHAKIAEVMRNAGIKEIKGSCPLHCPGCYCDNGCYNFPENKARAIEKLIIARMFTEWLEKAITAQIIAEHKKNAQVRIHAQGEFFSVEYAETWKHVINNVKGVCDIFWTYTKEDVALETLLDVDNLSIVPSKTPYGFNFGTCKELLYMYEKLTMDGFRVHICACGTPFEKHCSECNTGCKAVGKECDYVLFIKHSTKDYTAGEKDAAELARVIEIIKNQDN